MDKLIDSPKKTFNGYEYNALFYNTGSEAFVDFGYLTNADVLADGRGLGLADFDRDGDVDIVIQNHAGATNYLVNEGTSNHWIQLRLRGTRSNRDSIGATVRIRHGAQEQWQDVVCGAGYLSCQSKVIHFGLGEDETVEEIEIRWPSGTTKVLANVAADQRLTVVEPDIPELTSRR